MPTFMWYCKSYVKVCPWVFFITNSKPSVKNLFKNCFINMDIFRDEFSDGKEGEELEFVLMDVVHMIKVLVLFKVT